MNSKDAQIEYLQVEVDQLRKEIKRLTTPTLDGKCAVCGAYIGDTTYYKITDGEKIK